MEKDKSEFKAIVGIGNIGTEYNLTRHNIGFDIVDGLAGCFYFPNFKQTGKLAISSGLIGGGKVFLCKPCEYVNNSGPAVLSFLSFHKIHPCEVLVIHDDMTLAFGKLRYKLGGGSGGHNGIKSLDRTIGPNYYRLRVGIGTPPEFMDVSSFVLGRFTSEEQSFMYDKVLPIIFEFGPKLVTNNFEQLINKANNLTAAPPN